MSECTTEEMMFLGATVDDLTAIVSKQAKEIDRLNRENREKDDQIERLSIDLACYRGKLTGV